jgi:lipopolysaccharide export system ATP-binding protein
MRSGGRAISREPRAGVLSILKPFRRKSAPQPPRLSSELWEIDLGPVAEPLTNGHTEAMSFATTERMSLGRQAKRPAAQPIGKMVERDFDWKSVQTLDVRRDDEEPHAFNDADFAPAAPAFDRHESEERFEFRSDESFERRTDEDFPRRREEAVPRRTEERSRERNGDESFERPGAPILDRVLEHASRPLSVVAPEAGALTVQGVEKSFGGRKVVRGVSLTLRRGEAVGLLGPNGAGKTTVFYMITGLIKADKGKIQFDGHEITHLPMYQRARLGIGYLPQEASIFRGLNVEDNIRAVLEVVEPSKKKREAELDKLLDEFNIARLRKTPSIALSGGERRRTEIARALATRPSYMLLDEPFAGIDPIAVGDIQQLVRHLTERGIGVLITDHNVRETLGLTDRAYIIYSGEVLREGHRDEIIHDPEVRRLYLGEDFRM